MRFVSDDMSLAFSKQQTRRSAMVDELEQFQQDLLESVRQMNAGEAARVTQMPLSAAEEQSVEASSTLHWETALPLTPPVQ